MVRQLANGAGTPVLAVHGVTTDGRAFRPVFPADCGIRAFACDLRGHGASPDGGPWNLAQQVADLRSAIASLNSQVVLVGHSFGGLVALHTALTEPRSVRRLVLIDPAIAIEHAEPELPLRWWSLAEARVAYEQLLDAETRDAGMAWFDEAVVVNADGTTWIRCSPLAIREAWRAMQDSFVPSAPPKTTILRASRDSLLTVDVASRLNAQVLELEGPHDLIWAQPAAVRRVVVSATAAAV